MSLGETRKENKMAILKPIRNTIFVLPDQAPETSKGGIILTDFSRKRPTTGTIIAVGDLVTGFKPEQRVVYGEFSGDKRMIEHKGEDVEIFLMTPDDILAILE